MYLFKRKAAQGVEIQQSSWLGAVRHSGMSKEIPPPSPSLRPDDRRCHPIPESPPHKRFSAGCSSPFMRLVGLLTVLHAWCKQAISAWSVKTRRASSRQYTYGCEGIWSYDYSKVMHDMSTPPHPLWLYEYNKVKLDMSAPPPSPRLPCGPLSPS